MDRVVDPMRWDGSDDEVSTPSRGRLLIGSTTRSILGVAAVAAILLVLWRLAPENRDASSRTSADEGAVPNVIVGGDPAVPIAESRSVDPTAGAVAVSGRGPGPGAGVVVGRLIDAATGLPIVDAGVTLRDRGRRAISGPGGAFRFDAVDGHDIALIIGPAEGYLPRGITFKMKGDGVDLNLIALEKADPATPIEADYGGVVAGCGPTRLSIPAGAFDGPRLVRVTCIEHSTTLPLEPPPGRLPLAVVDLAPADALLALQAELRVELPSQPRFASGISLDLFRFDLDLLQWIPAGTLEVDGNGGTASGRLDALGTYLVAAPPFGAFGADVAEGPTITRYAVAGAPDAPPVGRFPPETYVVFGAFDYTGMDNTPILVRTTDPNGEVIYESLRPYSGSGQDIVPMIAPSGPWPIGDYDSTWYIGDPPRSVGPSITWRVDARPTPQPTPPPIPYESEGLEALGGSSWSTGGRLAAELLSPPLCTKPLLWYDYPIKSGETLTEIARRTGTSASILIDANCLASPAIFAGRILWVPQVPMEYPAPYIPKPLVPTPYWPVAQPTLVPSVPGGGSIIWPTKAPPPQATLATRPTSPIPPPPLPPPWAPPSGPSDGGAQGGAGGGRGVAPAPQPAVPPPAAPPPSNPSPVPPKDPAPVEPTLAPRPPAP